ncbi:D-erythronate dehydrogenase-like [Oppia nitens]|uniref:D-erythronate dehydrogenase-like n=1 Tax=Oppia nitens TaxID=1686743 RepID=UPI0023DA2FD9|nr:D-erythronate dehydrogenase-like [Oppia nitens]
MPEFDGHLAIDMENNPKTMIDRRRSVTKKFKILITGGNGFLGQQLAAALLQPTNELKFDELILVDIFKPMSPIKDDRVRCLVFDLTRSQSYDELFHTNIDIIFHLAAVVSGQAEKDMELGHKVNVEATHLILEAIRQRNRPLTRLVFASSCAVYSWPQSCLDRDIDERTQVLPHCTYGYQKAISEHLISDYTRRGYIDGRILRLPTITVRPGVANQAVTSFVSGIIREPLNGVVAKCPVNPTTRVWISSPEVVIKNFIHAARLPALAFGVHTLVNLPGITVSVDDMVSALAVIAGKETAELIRFEYNEDIDRIVSSLSVTYDVTRALNLGFSRDTDVSHIIHNYMDSELTDTDSSSDDTTDEDSDN